MYIPSDNLAPKKLTIATAESCTGGRVAALITARSGASLYFRGGIVAYQNDVKETLLGVPADTIATHGVVSEAVARAMVAGACRLFHATHAVATTGYAEPWEGHNVEIWIACGTPDRIRTRCIRPSGTRQENQDEAAATAMEMLQAETQDTPSEVASPPAF